MEYIIKLGDDCNSDDYNQLIRNLTLVDMMPVALSVVNSFKDRFPTIPIDTVHLTISQDGSVSTEINKNTPDPTELRLTFEKKVVLETGLASLYYHQKISDGIMPRPIPVGDYYVTITVHKVNERTYEHTD